MKELKQHILEKLKVSKTPISDITLEALTDALKDYKEYSYIVSNDEKGIEEAFKYLEDKGKQIGKKYIDYQYKNEEIIDKITEIIERK